MPKHGEFGTACKTGLTTPTDDISLGTLLLDSCKYKIAADSISVVDLTGLGAQDLAIASMIFEKPGTSAHDQQRKQEAKGNLFYLN